MATALAEVLGRHRETGEAAIAAAFVEACGQRLSRSASFRGVMRDGRLLVVVSDREWASQVEALADEILRPGERPARATRGERPRHPRRLAREEPLSGQETGSSRRRLPFIPLAIDGRDGSLRRQPGPARFAQPATRRGGRIERPRPGPRSAPVRCRTPAGVRPRRASRHGTGRTPSSSPRRSAPRHAPPCSRSPPASWPPWPPPEIRRRWLERTSGTPSGTPPHPNPAPLAYLISGSPGRVAEALPPVIAARSFAGHLGAGVVERDGTAWLVLLASPRRARLSSFPRAVAVADTAVLDGELVTGLADPRLYVTAPDGSVQERSITGTRRFKAELRFDHRGRWLVEVVGRGLNGPEVLALLAVDAGALPPAAASSPPAGPDPEDPAAAEARVVVAVNATRGRHGLPPSSHRPPCRRWPGHTAPRCCGRGCWPRPSRLR